MTFHAAGTFDVKLTPEPREGEDWAPARMKIDKQFHGDLEALSKGEMLSEGTPAQGSAAYVALERVRGKLRGRSGAFVLQHSATMTRGVPQLSITVVPDSGTDDLMGLTGKMAVNIEAGRHSYEFEYALES